MRCKKHFTDLSSIIGVCASCLRERLFYLVAAQQQQPQTLTLDEPHPVFPRSVSPYITRRKSDTSISSTTNQRPIQRFFSTPQVRPTAREAYNNNNNNNNTCRKKKKNSFIRFSLLSKLFRSKKQQKEGESDSNPRCSVSVSVSNSRTSTSAMSSPFWFTNMSGSRKKHPFSFNESSTAVGRKQYSSDRGMSPVRYSDYGGEQDEEFCYGSSGYETCESREQTPWRTPVHSSVRRAGSGAGKNVTGLNFCLSPLVRASPCRHWNQKGVAPPPAADGGDMRVPVKPHLSNTKSFCANRSRKLADFGRFNSNR